MTTDPENATYIPFKYGYQFTMLDGVTVGLVDVTPELAELWLERNERNRKLSPQTIDRYSRDMAGGHWPFTGDPVRLSHDLTLLDGQHRLTAIVRTGITTTLLVITGLGEKTQTFMDAGRKRHPADTLAMDATPNYTAVASLVKLALLWNPDNTWVPDRGTVLFGAHVQVSPAEILTFVDRYPQVHEAARRGVATAGQVTGARASVIGAAYLRASLLHDVFEVAAWFDKLETGASLELGDPILALRNGMIRTRTEKLQNPQVPQLWKVIRAWNASRDGQSLDRLITPTAMTNTNFPDMR